MMEIKFMLKGNKNLKKTLMCSGSTILLVLSLIYDAGLGNLFAQTIVYPEDHSQQELLAAKEVRRYIYLRTGEILPVKKRSALPSLGDVILVANGSNHIVKRLNNHLNYETKPGELLIKTISERSRHVLVITGHDSIFTLYAAYRFAEHLGVRFDLNRDIIPDKKISLSLSGFDEVGKPLFNILGILPFHDFPEGPDLWDTNDYMNVVSQLPKLGMNFLGLHNYHQWSSTGDKDAGIPQGPEPTVWIGLEEDINSDGTVNWSYPAYYAHTHRPDRIWGFAQMDTRNFHAGAGSLFETDSYGSDVIGEVIPTDIESSNRVFNRTGKMLDAAFSHAVSLGVKTAVGTELPMGLEPQGPDVAYDWIRGMPSDLQERLVAKGMDPADRATIQKIYQGIFERIIRTHPLDYYWLWSWEGWARWSGSEEQISTFKEEMNIAYETLRAMDAPFQLALGGWMIGKQDDFELFDDTVPKEVPFYGLWDEALGFEYISPRRPKWAATWLEEDWGLLQPQLNVDRVFVDAVAALKKQCEGFIAKHWRTRVLSPNTAAIKSLSWIYGKSGEALKKQLPSNRNEWINDFYLDWSVSRFGKKAAQQIAKIFINIETSTEPGAASPFEIMDWDTDEVNKDNGAPSSIAANEDPWETEKLKYKFVDEFENLRPEITSAGSLERFDYWLNVFKAFRLMGEYGTFRYQFETASEEGKWEDALGHRKKMARLFENIMKLQIEKATNSSDLGEIINLEILNWYQLVHLRWDEEMVKGLGREIPDDANPSMAYTGKPSIMVDVERASLTQNEPFSLTVRVIGNPESVTFNYRQLGKDDYKTKEVLHVVRGVYSLEFLPEQEDFEYYIEAKIPGGKIVYPTTAPAINQTVVVLN
jgi:hypothetical protein